MSNVASITDKRLKREPILYTVVFRHGEDGFSFVVHDIQDSEKDRLAVARDLEEAAISLRSNCGPATT